MTRTHLLSIFGIVCILGIAASAKADDAYRPYYVIDNPPPKGTHVVVHSPITRAVTATTDALVGVQDGIADVSTDVFDAVTSVQHDTVITTGAPYPPHAVAQDDSSRY